MIHHPGGRVHCSLRIGLLCGYFSGELITAGRKEGVTELPSSYYFVCIYILYCLYCMCVWFILLSSLFYAQFQLSTFRPMLQDNIQCMLSSIGYNGFWPMVVPIWVFQYF